MPGPKLGLRFCRNSCNRALINKHGNLAQWQALVDSVPHIPTAQRVLDADAVQIGGSDDLSVTAKQQLESQLKALHPWRKGRTTCSAST